MPYVKARQRSMRGLGVNAFTNAWDYYFDFPSWLANNQAPLTEQQKQDLANAAVRARGIDPATNKPIAPQYAQQLPQDQPSLDALVASINAKVKSQAQADFNKSVQDLQNQANNSADSAVKVSAPWLIAGLVVAAAGGAAVVFKAARR